MLSSPSQPRRRSLQMLWLDTTAQHSRSCPAGHSLWGAVSSHVGHCPAGRAGSVMADMTYPGEAISCHDRHCLFRGRSRMSYHDRYCLFTAYPRAAVICPDGHRLAGGGGCTSSDGCSDTAGQDVCEGSMCRQPSRYD